MAKISTALEQLDQSRKVAAKSYINSFLRCSYTKPTRLGAVKLCQLIEQNKIFVGDALSTLYLVLADFATFSAENRLSEKVIHIGHQLMVASAQSWQDISVVNPDMWNKHLRSPADLSM